VANFSWSLSDDERRTLEQALDALLPPSGSFPLPSATGLIDQFILKRVPDEDAQGRLYPRIDAPALSRLLAELDDAGDMTDALSQFQRQQPKAFKALWRLAVYGYYSQPETIAAIQRDLAPAYHGAPLPLGYADAIAPWDAYDPLQLPRNPRGTYIPTDQVKRVEAPWLNQGKEEA
jgi:hypothetical protein